MLRDLVLTIEAFFLLLARLTGGTLLFAFYGAWLVGIFYWLWLSIQLGSFWMFVVGMLLPFMVATGPIGAYALIFGIPQWIYSLFG